MGGIYNPFNLNLYAYSHQNPVKYIDPDGNAAGFVNKTWEAFKAAIILGPLDAYSVARGEYYNFAVKQAHDFSKRYGNGLSGEKKERIKNAVRHVAWMAKITQKHGKTKAKEIGRLHELGEEGSKDSYIDKHNNIVGREIGEKVGKDGTNEHIIEEIDKAFKKGKLIIDWNDERVPEDLPKYKGSGSLEYGGDSSKYKK